MNFSDNDFLGKDLKESKFSGLMLFSADWCGHCKALRPTWDMLSGMMKNEGGTSFFAKVDCTSSNKGIVKALGITGFPSIVAYKDGRYAAMYSGDRSEKSLKEYVANNFANTAKVQPTPPKVSVGTDLFFVLGLILFIFLASLVLKWIMFTWFLTAVVEKI